MSHDHRTNKVTLAPFVWFLMGSGVSLILLLGGWGFWFLGMASESSNFLNLSLTSSKNEAKAVKQLTGHWKLVTINNDMPSSLFFTEDNVFLVGTSENQADAVAYFNIESDDQVNYLFFIDPDNEISNQVLIAIFDFSEPNQLRIEFLMSDDPPGSRPETSLNFSDDAVVYEKVSTVISDRIEITPLDEQAPLARQVEARNNIAAALRAQQVFYLEQGRFSDSLRDLGIGLRLETDDYFYKTIFIEPNRIVTMAAQSKKSALKSLIGIAYVSERVTSIKLCESNEPTMNLPSQATFNQGGQVTCPEGYSEL